MSIEKRTLSDGSVAYLARFRTPDGQRRSRQFRLKKDARAWEESQAVRWRAGEWVDPKAGQITVAEWVEVWTRDYTADLRPTTRTRVESMLANHVLPRFGTWPLANLDHALLQAWVTDLSKGGLSPASVEKVVQQLSKVLNAAVDARKIPSNPASRLKRPKVERKDQRFLTPTQVRDLASTMDPRYKAMVLVGAFCGLRAGELLGLRWKHVHLLKRELYVREIVVEHRGHLQYGPPKTKAAIRTVPIPANVCAELSKIAMAGQDPEAHVFTAPEGGPIRLGLWRRRFWHKACVEAGLGWMVKVEGREKYEGLRIHDLRHTAVALWICAGASPVEVAKRAGHRSVVTVLDHYGHVFPQADDPVNAALNEMAAVTI